MPESLQAGGIVMVVQTAQKGQKYPAAGQGQETGIQGTAAELITAQLAAWGVKTLYGVSGDAIFPLLDSVARQQALNFLPTIHEFSAAYMAVTEARLSGRPAVCTATSGPGTVNLLNGLAEAYRDRVPVLAITGDVKSAALGLNVKQGINQQQLLAAVTGYSAVVRDPGKALPLLQEAMRVAAEQQTAAHVAIPKDIFKMPAAGTLQPLPPAFRPSVPPARDFEPFAGRLKSFSRPLILAGQEARTAAAETVQLADQLGIGIILAQGARGIVPGAHPLVLGGLGEAYIPAPLNQADVILMIGTAPYEMNYLPPNIPLMQIAPGPEYIRDAPVQPAAALTGDIPVILQKMGSSLAGYRPATQWRSILAAAHHDWLRQVKEDSQDYIIPLAPRRLAAELNRFVSPDAILAMDVGEFMHWFDRSFTGHRQRLLLSGYWRCMGSALPAAIAAKGLYPDKQVAAITGDGGFLMSMYELVTAVKYRLPVTIIIFNNGKYALEEHKMQAGGLIPAGVDLPGHDFALFARACGADGYSIKDPAELTRVLPEALNSGRPALVDVKVSASEPPFTKA
jgi:pyruvate dehydrogenase (quinone)/pyruvate oxidase